MNNKPTAFNRDATEHRREEAARAVGRFVAYDEAAIVDQFTHRNDQQALIASSKQVAADLEKIFEEDAKSDGV